MLRQLSLRFRLAVLVAGTTLPLILFSAGFIYRDYAADRQSLANNVREVTRALVLAVDRELQSMVSALQVLSQLRALQDGDLQSFRAQAETYLRQQLDGTNLVLADQTGRQIINVAQASDQPPRMVRDIETLRAVFLGGTPIVSNLYRDGESGAPVVSINVPVRRGDAIVYALSLRPPLRLFDLIIREQAVSPEWVVSIFDRNGVNVARVPNGERFVGVPASASFLPALLAQNEGMMETISLEGTPLLTVFSRSNNWGWRVGMGVPQATLTKPLWRSLAWTIAIGLLCLVVGLAFALRMARRIALAESHQNLLINELNHRVKNTMTTVQAIAHRTLRNSANGAEAVKALEARIIALSRAHDVLSEEQWEGADLRDLVHQVLQPHAPPDRTRLVLSGPSIRLSPRAALTIALVLHELATNAAKYGALSDMRGRLWVTWSLVNDGDTTRVRLVWNEGEGPAVYPPERRGFGSTLIERGVEQDLRGSVKLDFAPGGVVCVLEFPLAPSLAARDATLQPAPPA